MLKVLAAVARWSPPDYMPNSEVKRRSADGGVGSPRKYGDCGVERNKTKGPVGRQGLCYDTVSAGWRLPPYSAHRNIRAYEAGGFFVEPMKLRYFNRC